jgi:hypothetical protein
MSAAQPAWRSTGSHDFHAALFELGIDLRHVAELGGADRGKILRVREQHHPVAADEVVELDLAFGGLGFEIRHRVIDLKRHHSASLVANHV